MYSRSKYRKHKAANTSAQIIYKMTKTVELFYRELGEGQPLVILHGLFGSSDNWYSLSKQLAEHFKVYVVDQRNHGQSPHTTVHDYVALTDDLNHFLDSHKIVKPVVIGHSMGGKTAMNFAIAHPDKLSKLIVVDIVPKSYPVHHDTILDGLKAIDLKELKSRGDADRMLSEYVPEPEVRQFLLKNLGRDSEQKFEWRINIPVLESHIEDMGASLQFEGKYEGPTLFILGSKSNYFKSGDEVVIRKYFPSAELRMMETGHWVQAQQPDIFLQNVLQFTQSPA